MYSFKYHLLTICAVFLALAVGLLLGSAIGGSGLLSTTTSDLVESLSERFTDLDSRNSELSQEIEIYESLSSMFVDYWDDDRLSGSDVLIISGSDSEQTSMAQDISDYVESAGGRSAIVQVSSQAFGLEDEDILAAVQEVLPEVEGQDYQDVLAEALVAEWTSSEESEEAFDGGRISSNSAPTDEDREAYPVTCALIDSGIITFTGTSTIPGTINCMVNTLLYQPESSDDDSQQSSPTSDPVAGRIASAMYSTGASVVFTQYEDASEPLMDDASSRGLAGVQSYEGSMGRYSIVSLLSTGQTGNYGSSNDSSHWYPVG